MFCELCGKEMTSPVYSGEFRTVCPRCFSDKFWMLIIAEKDRHVVIDGECYAIEDEKSLSSFRGCGGRRFVILMNDGRKIVTTNLWCQGTIPEKFRNDLPDNAKFIKDDIERFSESLL